MSDLQVVIRRVKRSNEIKIDLSSKGVTFVPIEVYQLNQLEVLDMSNNKITSLDAKISQLSNLKILDLSNNSLQSLPQSILELKNLQALNLLQNPLSKQFEILLKQENQAQPRLNDALKICFGIQPDEESKSSDDSSWLNQQQQQQFSDGKSQMGLMNDIVDKDNQIQKQKQKIDELTAKLEKLNLQQQKSQGQSLGISPLTETVLELDINELQIGEQISQGGFSTVHKGKFRGTQVAIKKIFNPNITSDVLDELNNEINMLATLRHPQIVLLMGIVSKPPNLCIVTEFLPKGDLFTLLHKQKQVNVSNQTKLLIAQQIVNIFVYLHQCKVTHRDLKSYNILLDENNKVKLCDFGLARKFSELNTGTSRFSGTPNYMAPELYLKKAYDQSVDVFAFGTLLYELFAREVPYEGLEHSDIMQKVQKQDSLPQKAGIPQQIMQIVKDCRKVNPSERLNFEEIAKNLSEFQI